MVSYRPSAPVEQKQRSTSIFIHRRCLGMVAEPARSFRMKSAQVFRIRSLLRNIFCCDKSRLVRSQWLCWNQTHVWSYHGDSTFQFTIIMYRRGNAVRISSDSQKSDKMHRVISISWSVQVLGEAVLGSSINCCKSWNRSFVICAAIVGACNPPFEWARYTNFDLISWACVESL